MKFPLPLAAFVIGTSAICFSSCKQKEPTPAEELKEAVKDAAKDVKDAVKDAVKDGTN